MVRFVLIGMFFLCVAAPTRAETAIDCAQSPVKMTVPGKYTCQDLGVQSGDKNTSQFRRTNLFGTSNESIKLSVQLYQSMCNGCFIHDYTVSQDAKDRIQKFNNMTRGGKNWSEMRKVDGSTYAIAFDNENRHCTGFIHGDGFVKGGYGYYVDGYFCAAEGKPAFADGDLKTLISSITVATAH
jgi:hypothetical protein